MAKIASVGFLYPDDEVEHLEYLSTRSVLDADIIVFEPKLPPGYGDTRQFYEGKRILTENASFRVKEAAAHWRSELDAALAEGKTIVVFLVPADELKLDTGKRTYSGTGRNRVTTRIVEDFSPYAAVPVLIAEFVPKSGEEIRATSILGSLAPYWSEYAEISPYQAYFSPQGFDVLLTTKAGGKAVGALQHRGKGTILLLPPPQFAWDELYEEFGEETGNVEIRLTKGGKEVGKRLTQLLVEIDRAFRFDSQSAPAPEWANDDRFQLPEERSLRNSIEVITNEVDARLLEKAKLHDRLEVEGSLRALLYERGKRLETAVIEALRILGFTAAHFSEGESEFDVVFFDDEGRYLGEVEGKETKPLNIDKLSQLERNIQEDFARDGVDAYAKGVLFGNVHIAIEPEKRPADFFTAKCVSGAARSSVALVRTPDLFFAALAIKRGAEESYSKLCRAAIKNASGTVVEFPKASEGDRMSEELVQSRLGDA